MALEPVSAKGALPRAVIFDLDGTLIDSAGDVSVILNEILRQEQVPAFTTSEVKALMGEGIGALIRKALVARGLDMSEKDRERLTARFLERYCDDPVAFTTIFPFTREVLSDLVANGILIGICTNKAERPARLILERLGLAQHVCDVVAGDSGFGQKPDPGPLIACAVRLGVEAAQVVYVGDHVIDVQTARAANVPVIAVAHGYSGAPAAELGADRVIQCLSELPVAVRGLIAG